MENNKNKEIIVDEVPVVELDPELVAIIDGDLSQKDWLTKYIGTIPEKPAVPVKLTKKKTSKKKVQHTKTTKKSELSVSAPGRDIPDHHLHGCEDLLELVKKAIGTRCSKPELRSIVHSFCGRRVNVPDVERVITTAKQYMVIDLQIDPKIHRAKSLTFYEWVIGQDNIPIQIRMEAQSKLDKLLGLDKDKGKDRDPGILARLINDALGGLEESTDSEF